MKRQQKFIGLLSWTPVPLLLLENQSLMPGAMAGDSIIRLAGNQANGGVEVVAEVEKAATWRPDTT